jgi:hypothetical protein
MLGFLSGETVPGVDSALALLAVGATGYGLSLRLYLLAQREFGAARTGSVFAFAPFIGAALALALGGQGASIWTLVGAALMLAGILLHLTERHLHEHDHGFVEHEHAHSHADLHHAHVHLEAVAGTHSHPHRHEPTRHAHAHTPDDHHRHAHDVESRK